MNHSRYAKKLLVFLLLLSSTSAFSAGNQTIPLKEYDLVGIDLDTSANHATGWVHCSSAEITNGLSDLLWMASGKAPGRELTPTNQPLERKAAWLISNDDKGCRSLNPYFNGVGFESFDQSTGQVTAYIGAFNKIDNSSEFAATDNGYTKMRLLFQPEYTLINIIKFNGTCSFQKLGMIESVWKKALLVCDFGKSGKLTLAPR